MDVSQIGEHFAVQAKESGNQDGAGVQVGVVDQVEGQFVKLTKNDSPDGQHHWFPVDWIDRIDQQTLYLNKTAAEVKAGLLDSPSQLTGQATPKVDTVTGAGVD